MRSSARYCGGNRSTYPKPVCLSKRRTPDSLDEFGAFSPDCSCIISVKSGPSWQNLTIGESSLEDVQSILGVEGTQSPQDNSWNFRDAHEAVTWYKAEACFVEQKLAALYIARDPNIGTMDLDQILDQFGKPNRVTWGPDFNLRALIWPEQGMLVFVPLAGLKGGPILLFSPMPSNVLETSWLIDSLPEGPIGSPAEDETYGENNEVLTVEDPWGIEK